jgi:hypothetical protein
MPPRADDEEIAAMTASITDGLAVLTVHRGTAPTWQEPFDGSGSAAWATLHVQDDPGFGSGSHSTALPSRTLIWPSSRTVTCS